MANRYWVGNGGNWSDTAHWSTTSGGAGGAAVPTSSDNVYFDANSFSATAQTVTLTASASCGSFVWTGATNSPTFDMQGYSISIYGTSVTLISAMTLSSNAYQFKIYGRGAGSPVTLTTAGKTIPGYYLIFRNDTSYSNSVLNLADDLTQGTLSGGGFEAYGAVTVNTNNHNVNAFYALNFDDTVVFNCGTSTITSGSNIDLGYSTYDGPNNLSAGDATFVMNGAVSPGYFFMTAYQTVGAVTFANDSKIYGSSHGAGTINNLTVSAGVTLDSRYDTSIQVTTLNLNGTSGSPVTITSSDATTFTITKTSGTVTASYCNIDHLAASGGATFNAYNSTDNGNNSGWNFINTKTQPSIARVANTRNNTQPAIARISSTYTSTTGAIARIANYKTATIAATARVYGILTKTQAATAKITVTRVASIAGTAYITYPAELMTRYDYKVYRDGTFVGLLPVVSEYLAAQDINTAGSQITIEVAQTADTARIAATTTIDDESGVPLQDEAGNDLLTEGAINVVGLGADTTIVKNGNWVKVIEYSKWHPNGIVAFHGKMVRFEAPLGSDNDTETIKVLCNSTGEDLNNHCIKTSGGNTTVSFTTVDPSTGMLADSMDIYITEGGLVSYTGSTIDSTGLSLSSSFNTNTMFEAIGTFHSLSPDDFYWYVGLGDDLLYFKQSSATPDIYFDKGAVINQSTLVVSIENTVNQLLFTGGDTGGGTNLFRKYEDATSQSQFGVLLDRRNDNRVVLTATANAIGNTSITSSKGEQSQTPITILGDKIDLTTLHLGMTVGFRGYGTFVDNLVYRIVRIIRYPDKADIIIGTLPPRTTVTMAQIMRNLIAQDTINNPVAPS